MGVGTETRVQENGRAGVIKRPEYIAVARDLMTHWVWKEKPFSPGQAWVHLLLMAPRAPRKWRIGRTLETLPAGEFLTSHRHLQGAFGWGSGRVQRFLALLEGDRMIASETARGQIHLTICNWPVYQVVHSESGTETAHLRHGSGTNTERSEDPRLRLYENEEATRRARACEGEPPFVPESEDPSVGVEDAPPVESPIGALGDPSAEAKRRVIAARRAAGYIVAPGDERVIAQVVAEARRQGLAHRLVDSLAAFHRDPHWLAERCPLAAWRKESRWAQYLAEPARSATKLHLRYPVRGGA